MAELGRQGGQKNRRWKLDACGDLPHKPLKSIGDVSELLEETINRIRQGPFVVLLARYSEQKEGLIFPSKRARDGHLTTVAKQFEKARKEAGSRP
jgi:hypothetical protein